MVPVGSKGCAGTGMRSPNDVTMAMKNVKAEMKNVI